MQSEELLDLLKQLRYKKKEEFDRVLPVGELLSDRWEKAIFLNFGEKTSIYDSSIVMGDVTVGKDTWIGPFTVLDGSGGKLSIGNHCDISAGVHIYTHDTVKNCVSGGKVPYEYASVNIGNCCYIAPKVLIGKGVNLGDHCVVCTGSFVNRSYENYSIIAGTPAIKIGEVVLKDKEVEFRYYHRKVKKNENSIF